jgi:hypothetical protein
VLDRISGTADALAITNLGRLLQRPWFRNAFPENQRLSENLVVYLSQHSTGDATIINHSLDVVLSDGNLKLVWEDGILAPAYEGAIKPVPGQPSVLKISKAYGGEKQMQHLVETLAHEICHFVNNDRVGKSYRYFMAEYRAWYVGQKAMRGHAPSPRECWGRARYLVISETAGYAEIGAAFRDMNSGESKKIVEFIARIRGDDPAKATIESVLDEKKLSLSETQAGLSPEKANPDDPNILDNHHF